MMMVEVLLEVLLPCRLNQNSKVLVITGCCTIACGIGFLFMRQVYENCIPNGENIFWVFFGLGYDKIGQHAKRAWS